SQFDILLAPVPLTRVQTLAIDVETSSLQHSRFPHLPHLIILRLCDVRQRKDAYKVYSSPFTFTCASHIRNKQLVCIRKYTERDIRSIIQSTERLETFVEHILLRLNTLRSLDLSQDFGMGLPLWDVNPIECRLSYLRLPLQCIQQLCKVMSLEKLSTTLEQVACGNANFKQRSLQ
ncbi:unnamed protein product, partial [Adineta ricciae]